MNPTPNTGISRRSYNLIEVLGSGAFGVVYLAEQDSGADFRRKVALKLLNGHRKSKEAGRRMRDEARLLGLLHHRNIITVFDLVPIGEQWALVMEHIDGPDVDRLIEAVEKEKERIPLTAVFEIAAGIAEALDAAWHAKDKDGKPLSVVHRDIKPSNVLLTPAGEVKVLDFGVARMDMSARESHTGALVGTERYMSPERWMRMGDTPAGDVYALCASVVEMLVLEPLGPTPVDPGKHALFVERRLAAVEKNLPEGKDREDTLDLLRQGLYSEHEDRPTARALADEFERLAARYATENLRAFCRRFLPRLPAVLGVRSEPATGTLFEGSLADSYIANSAITREHETAITLPPATERLLSPGSPPLEANPEHPAKTGLTPKSGLTPSIDRTGPPSADTLSGARAGGRSNGVSLPMDSTEEVLRSEIVPIETVREVVTALAVFVGPASRMVVLQHIQKLGKTATTLTPAEFRGLIAQVSTVITEPPRRQEFLKSVARYAGDSLVDIETVRKVVPLLSAHLGPAAKMLLKNEIDRIGRTPSTLTPSDLSAVATSASRAINSVSDRERFMAETRKLFKK